MPWEPAVLMLQSQPWQLPCWAELQEVGCAAGTVVVELTVVVVVTVLLVVVVTVGVTVVVGEVVTVGVELTVGVEVIVGVCTEYLVSSCHLWRCMRICCFEHLPWSLLA